MQFLDKQYSYQQLQCFSSLYYYTFQKEFFLYVVGTAITKRKLALICKYDLMKLQWLVLAALIRIVTNLSQSSDVATRPLFTVTVIPLFLTESKKPTGMPLLEKEQFTKKYVPTVKERTLNKANLGEYFYYILLHCYLSWNGSEVYYLLNNLYSI